MSLTLLLIGGAIMISAFYVVTAWPSPAIDLGGQHTAVGLSDPGAETMTNISRTPAPLSQTTEWKLRTVNNLSSAEDWLDCLENQGIAERELIMLGNSSFAIRWR